MHYVTLNIGTQSPSGELMTAAINRAMNARHIKWEDNALIERRGENTYVVTGYASDAQVDALARDLEQECIAVFDWMHNEGRLVGPGKDKWGEFDRAKFFTVQGKALSEYPYSRREKADV